MIVLLFFYILCASYTFYNGQDLFNDKWYYLLIWAGACCFWPILLGIKLHRNYK